MIIATGCDFRFIESCKTLIASIHRYSYDIVNEIKVFDLGLTNENKMELEKLDKVKIHNIPLNIIEKFPHFMEIKNFGWKVYIIHSLYMSKTKFLYIDSGACFTSSINSINDIIEKEKIFMVGDVHLLKNFIHSDAIKIMNVTEVERNRNIIWAGCIGATYDEKYMKLFDDALYFATIKECICGNIQVHRHDQSIFTVLAHRYNVPLQPISIFGEWRTHTNKNQIVYVHRNTYKNHNDLKYS